MVKRGGFTFIELLFAIVIISVVVVSLPMMNQTNTQTMSANIVQEAIFAASTQLNSALTPHWDENSMQDDKNALARVIDDGSCDDETRLKIGHIAQTLHRRCLDSNETTASNSSSDDEVDALEDMEVSEQNLTDETSSAQGYKQNYKYSIFVTNDNVSFGSLSNDKNLKKVTIVIKDENDNNLTLLHSYSANIGEVDFYKKRYE